MSTLKMARKIATLGTDGKVKFEGKLIATIDDTKKTLTYLGEYPQQIIDIEDAFDLIKERLGIEVVEDDSKPTSIEDCGFIDGVFMTDNDGLMVDDNSSFFEDDEEF